MRLLVLGGTLFVGRHLVEAALAKGHQVTLFHRGQTNPGLFPAAEEILGDRLGDLAGLAGRRWDAVLDTSGYLPRAVRAAAELLRGAVGCYAFVSTISVYADLGQAGLDESSPLHAPEEEGDPRSSSYGPLKVRCEQVLSELLPTRVLCIRPTLIAGPHDPTGRFAYWLSRVKEGGEVLAPIPADQPIQLIDARDLAAWILRQVEAGGTGTFNAVGPREGLTLGELLAACRQATGSGARITWVGEELLLDNGVRPWRDLPLWLERGERGLFAVDGRRALAAGLRLRPLAETLRDAPAADGNGGFGLPRSREEELLRLWRG